MLREYNRKRISSAQRARIERLGLINSLIAQGKTQSEVARMLGISRQAINQLINREKYSARKKLNYAIKKGHKGKPLLCMECQKEKLLTAHHDNYDEPLYVYWYCEPCHAEIDRRGWPTRKPRS